MLKVGLLGAGYLGKIHLRLLSAMKDIEFNGFFDTNETNSKELNQQYALKGYTSADDLIDQSDLIVIATPTTTHFAYTEKCMQKGKHVFVEKPVTSDLIEALSLQKRMIDHPMYLQIGMVERFNPAYKVVTHQLKTVQKIFCNRLAPFTPRGADVSVVFDVMIHDLDIVLSIANSEVKKIKAFGQKIVSTTYDVATAVVEFDSGLIAHFTASRNAERKYRLMEIIESDGVYKVDFLNKKTTLYNVNNDKRISAEEAYIGHSGVNMAQVELPVADSNAIEDELKSCIDSIINNKKVVVSLDDGIRAMQLAKAIEDQMSHQS